MKDLLTAVLATTWVLLVVCLRGRRRRPREGQDQVDREFRDLVARANHKATAVPWYDAPPDSLVTWPHAHDEHGASSYAPDIIALANLAHTTGQLRCPIHGSICGRAKKARETGLSQTDEDVGRRAVLSDGTSAH